MILVTGGTGLVGSHLLVRLAQENEPIRAIYRTSESIEKTKKVFSYYTNIAKDLFANIEWVQADITEVPSMIPAFKGVKKVYHCAAVISFDPTAYRTMRKVNIHGTAIIANLAIDAKVEKLCFVSSIATIGDDPKKEFANEENDWGGNQSFTLKNTVIMETGGMKGRRKEMIREELHEILAAGFGVSKIHSEYGMTELLSQGYSSGDGIFDCPPWMKILARDTEDALTLVGANKTGGLNVVDLANYNSCSFIATQDLGKVYSNGRFEVLGRFDHSDIRGCNLMVM